VRRSDREYKEFLELFVPNERRLYAFIVSVLAVLVNANDVLQETSLLLWQKFREFKRGTDFLAWACRIAHFKVLKLKDKARRGQLLDPEVIELIVDESIAAAATLDQRSAALADCVSQLSAKDRQLLTLRYSESAAPREIAQKTGRSVDAVYKSLQRVHSSLFDCVRRRQSQEEDS